MSYRKKGKFTNVSPFQTSRELANCHSTFPRTRNIVGIILKERASGLDEFLSTTGWGGVNNSKAPRRASHEVSTPQKGVGGR